MEWNPNKPELLGLEFHPSTGPLGPSYRVDALNKAVVQRVDSTVTQTVDALLVALAPEALTGYVLVELLDAATAEHSDDPTTTTFLPTAVLDTDLENQSGTVSNAATLAVINNNPAVLSEYVNGIALTASSVGFGFKLDCAGVLTGRRIVDVRVCAEGAYTSNPEDYEYPAFTDQDWSVTIRPNAGGTYLGAFCDYTTGTFRAFPVEGIGDRIISTGEVYPSTFTGPGTGAMTQPWTVAQFEAFDRLTGANRIDMEYYLNRASGGPYQKIYRAWVEVDHIAENRLARKIIQVTRSVLAPGALLAGWEPVVPTHPAGTPNNYAKVNGTDPTMVLRQPRYGDTPCPPSRDPAAFRFSVPYLEASLASDVPTGLDQYPAAFLSAAGLVSTLGTAAGNRIVPFVMSISTTPSVDSQPYANVYDPYAYDDFDLQQEITSIGAQDYDGVIVVGRPIPNSTGFVPDLVVTLKRRSDDAVMGTAYVTKDLADQFPPVGSYGWRRMQVPFDGGNVSLAAATQYYLDFDYGPAFDESGSWNVPVLYNILRYGTAPNSGVGTYGGATDVASYGGNDYVYSDVPALIYVAPDVVEGFAVESVPYELPPTGIRRPITCIPTARLSWFAPVDPATDMLEIQRSDVDTDWQTIAYITDLAAQQFRDFEGRIGEDSYYRIRAVSTNTMISSAWSETLTVAPVSCGCGYYFTSNEYPERSSAYPDIYAGNTAERDYEFLEAQQRKYREVYGRDYEVGFRPLERRGTRFERTLVIDGQQVHVRPGPDAFNDLRELAAAVTSYVCVRDEDGNRWFGGLDVSAGRHQRPGDFYFADVSLTQTTDLPSSPSVISL